MGRKTLTIPRNPLQGDTGAITVDQKKELTELLKQVQDQKTEERAKKTRTLTLTKE
tara:strand:- start:33804 stop:33971 length:168 start_codon:yes stop_codon:yes gene_type:complete